LGLRYAWVIPVITLLYSPGTSWSNTHLTVFANIEQDATGKRFFCSSSKYKTTVYTPSFFNIGELQQNKELLNQVLTRLNSLENKKEA
jgi:hypothetical protein